MVAYSSMVKFAVKYVVSGHPVDEHDHRVTAYAKNSREKLGQNGQNGSFNGAKICLGLVLF